MNRKSSDALMRSDRVLVGVLAVVLAAGSAALGAATAYHPRTEQVQPVAAAPQPAPVAVAVQADANLRVTDVSASDQAEQLIMNKLLAEHRCLAEAMYYEARGEGVDGEKAVAEVIFHRMNTGNYGHSICAVVFEGAGKPGCQFSFACSGEMADRKVPEAWMHAQILAARILTGEERMNDETGGATSFHAVSVTPDWANYLQRTVQIGNHVFYKNPAHARTM
jgi:spore germination cell wall hydrolase CwlJ-like protein